MKGPLHSIQALRALAAWSVVAQHYILAFGSAVPAVTAASLILDRGRVGVDVFFVISGFVMALVTAETSPGRFLAKRAARIVPAYWLFTAVVALLILYVPETIPEGEYSSRFLVRSLLFIPTASTFGDYPLNSVGWTLNFEVVFYALIGLSLFAPARVRWWLVAGGIVALQQGVAGHFYTNPIIYEFLLGVVAAKLWQRGLFQGPARLYVLLGVAAVAAIVATPYNGDLRPIYWGVPSFVLVSACVRLEPLFARATVLKALGDHSYSVYLIHLSVLFLGSYCYRAFGWNLVAVSAVSLVLIAVLAAVSYRFIEAPARRFLTNSPRTQKRLAGIPADEALNRYRSLPAPLPVDR